MLKVTTMENLPRPTRNKKRTLEYTEEWQQFRAKVAEGLRPNEAIYITFTKTDLEKLSIKTVGRIFVKMAKDYIRKLSLPFDVWRYHSEGNEVIVVAARALSGRSQPAVEAIPAPIHATASHIAKQRTHSPARLRRKA